MLNDHNDRSNQYNDILNSRHKQICETVTLINDDITTLLNIHKHMYDLSYVCVLIPLLQNYFSFLRSEIVCLCILYSLVFPENFVSLRKINIFLLKTMRCCILFWLDLLTFRWKNIWKMSKIILYDWESSEERFVFLRKFCNASNVQTIQHHFLWQQVKKIILDKDKWISDELSN